MNDRLATHLLNHVGAGGPDVAEIGDVGLHGKGGPAVLVQDSDEVEPVVFALVEMHADMRRPVEPGGEGEGLAQPAIAAGAGDQDALALHAGGASVGNEVRRATRHARRIS